MGQVIVAEGTSLDDLHPTPAGAGKQIRHGSPFTITIQLPWYLPAAPFFDQLGSEAIADQLFNKTRAHLRDVSGEGLHTIVLHMEANAFQITLASVGAVVAILVGLGIVAVTVKILVDPNFLDDIKPSLDAIKWVAIAVVALVIIGVLAQVKRSGGVATSLEGLTGNGGS